MANVAEMERVITHITDHPEQHKQASWTCNTGACMAGHAALLNGYEVMQDKNGDVVNGAVRHPDTKYAVEGDYDTVRSVAMEIFDIYSEDADLLFCGSNTRDTLALMVKDIANGDQLEDHWQLMREYSDGRLRPTGEPVSPAILGDGTRVVVARRDNR